MRSLAFVKANPKIELVLPWPPTVNHYWRTTVIGGRAVTYLAAEGKAYRAAVLCCVPVEKRLRLQGRLAVTIVARPPDRRRRDIDNIQKAVFDAAAYAHVYLDDGQIDSITIERADPVPGGALELTVQEIAL